MTRPRLTSAVALLAWTLVVPVALHRSRSPTVLSRYSPEWAVLLGAVVLAAAVASVLAIARGRRSPAPAEPWRARPGDRRRAVLGLALSTLVALGVVELLIRRLDLFGASLFPEVWRYALDTVADPELFYRQRPGLDTIYQGVPVRFNELGLRERPIGVKPPGAARVLVLGDSVVFGWGVREEDTFARRLETELSRGRGRPVETINSGVCSYNTVQEERFLERHGDALALDGVVLVYVENDVTPGRPIPRDLDTIRALWTSPDDAIPLLVCRSWTFCLLREIARGALAAPGASAAVRDAGWSESMASLASVAAWCRERGIPLVAFLYRMTPSPKGDALLADLAALSARDGFPVSDTLPFFEGRELRPLMNSFLDSHPNARGHELVAQRMAEVLLAHGVPR